MKWYKYSVTADNCEYKSTLKMVHICVIKNMYREIYQ